MMQSVAGPGLLAPGKRLAAGQLLCCLMFSLVVAMAARGWRLALACAIVLALTAYVYPAGLRVLLSRRSWLFLVLLLIPISLLGDPPYWIVAGANLSLPGMLAGGQMALRAIAILISVGGFTSRVSVSELARLLEGAGLKGLGFALGVAFNMLPVLQDTATTTFQALRLRGGFRRRPLVAARLLLVTIIVNSLRHAEDIVGAAEARAFSTARQRAAPRRWPAGVPALAGLLAILAVALLW